MLKSGDVYILHSMEYMYIYTHTRTHSLLSVLTYAVAWLSISQANMDLTSNKAKPLFLYYAAHVAHEPYEVPASYESQFAFIDVEDRRVSTS